MEIETKYSIGDTVWIKRFDFEQAIAVVEKWVFPNEETVKWEDA